MNTAKRDKIILSVLAIIIIGVIMFYATIRPSMNEIETLNTKIESARQSIDGLKGKSQLINELKAQLEEVEAEVKANEGDIPGFDDYAVYLADFQDITVSAADTKISFNSITSSKSGHYVVVQAGVSFTCEYDDLKDIMDAFVQKKVHCYDVKFSVVSDAEDQTSTIVRVSFTAEYYSRNGAYTPIDYDFTSGRYGLTDLFDGSAYVAAIEDVTE